MVQQNLFKEPLRSISFDNDLILQNIIDLHCPGGFELDPTYSIGGFYIGSIQKPKFKFDISPQVPGVIPADASQLPTKDCSISTIMFDPPFLVGGGKNCKMSKRYSSFKGWKELKVSLFNCILEFYRILMFQGVLVFKCQDCVHGRKNYFTHVYVGNAARKIGFYPIDLFVLLSKNRIICHNFKNQFHARKFHSYYWVFKKTYRQNIDYSLEGIDEI